MMKKYIYTIAILIIFIILFIINAIADKKQLDYVVSEYKRVQATNTELIKENKELKERNLSLIEENISLGQKIENLKGGSYNEL